MDWKIDLIKPALCLLLGALAIVDHKLKNIPVWPVTAALCTGMINIYLNTNGEWVRALSGMAIGGILCVLSKLTKSRIGMGDGLITAVIGIYMGTRFTFICISTAFFLASITALFLICLKRVGKNHKIPFIPYIFAGYIITIWIWTGEMR